MHKGHAKYLIFSSGSATLFGVFFLSVFISTLAFNQRALLRCYDSFTVLISSKNNIKFYIRDKDWPHNELLLKN